MIALEALVSAATYIVLALLMGTLATAGFVLPPGENPLRQRLLSAPLILLPAFLLAAALALVLQGAKLSGGDAPMLEILVRYLTRTQSGKIWLWRELYAAALLLLALAFREGANPARVACWLFGLAIPLLASRSLMSHAAAVRDDTWLAISADAVHLVVTALWAGGLPALFWALRRGNREHRLPASWAARTVARFSRLALASMALLVATGLYQSWVDLQSWGALFETDYGRVLLLKLALFLPMAALGAVNLLSTKPNLAKAGSENPLLQRQALKRIGAESALGVLVLCVTGFLTALPPGVHSDHLKALAAGNRGLAPAEGASIKILSPKDGEVFTSDEVPIAFRIARGRLGHHAHAYVDGELMGMFESQDGTLTGIRPGRHTLELRVVADDHRTELDASDKIQFVVK